MFFTTITATIIFTIAISTILLRWNIKHSFGSARVAKVVYRVIIAINTTLAILLIGCIAYVATQNSISSQQPLLKTTIAVIIAALIPQVLYLGLSIPLDIAYLATRRRATTARVAVAVISLSVFANLTYYLARPNNNYELVELVITSKELPREFEGFKITQISDIHLGSLSKVEQHSLTKLATEVNSQQADIVVLTGDLISSFPSEAEGNVEWLKQIEATEGKYFIFGNHDVGSYNHHLSHQEIQNDINVVKRMVREAGWIVLQDSTAVIRRGSDSIVITNIDETNRHTYNVRAAKTVESLPQGGFAIQLSHNPDHWQPNKGLPKGEYPQLTLAGHTHAMQLEIKLLGIDWSPSDMIHKYSRGLYEENDKYLYINKGIGYHLYRRIGTRPEITVLTLKTEL